MDLKQLNYFVTIVEEGNITAASKKLHISQPPLSTQLKLLEEELGIKLLDRGSRKIVLTEAGKLLYKRANNILNLCETTKKELGDLKSGIQGTLSLGTISSSGAALLSKRMKTFHNEYPKVHFDIHEGNTYELIELLNAGIIEVAVVRTPFQEDKVNCIYLDEEPMIAVMQKNLDWDVDKREISLGELKDKPLIFYRRFENLIMSSCNNNGFEPNIFCKNEDARTTLMWANAGLGIGILPKSAFNVYLSENLTYKIINDKSMYTKITAIWIKNRYLSSIAESFLEVFRN